MLFAAKIAPTHVSRDCALSHMLVGRTISSHQRARRIAAYGTKLVGQQKPLSHNITDRIRNDSASVAVVFATSATLSILRWVNIQFFVCWSTACNETISLSLSFCFHMTPTFTGRKIRFSMCRSTWILKATPVLAHCCIFVVFLLEYPCVKHNFLTFFHFIFQKSQSSFRNYFHSHIRCDMRRFKKVCSKTDRTRHSLTQHANKSSRNLLKNRSIPDYKQRG